MEDLGRGQVLAHMKKAQSLLVIWRLLRKSLSHAKSAHQQVLPFLCARFFSAGWYILNCSIFSSLLNSLLSYFHHPGSRGLSKWSSRLPRVMHSGIPFLLVHHGTELKRLGFSIVSRKGGERNSNHTAQLRRVRRLETAEMLWIGNMSLSVPGSLGWAALLKPLQSSCACFWVLTLCWAPSESETHAGTELRVELRMVRSHRGDPVMEHMDGFLNRYLRGLCKIICPNKSAWMYHTNTMDVHWLCSLRPRTDLKRYSSGGPVQDQGSGIFAGCSWLRTHVQGHPPGPGRSRVLSICRQGPDPHGMNFSGQLPPSAMAHTVRQHKPFLPWLLLSGIWSQRKVTTAEGKA